MIISARIGVFEFAGDEIRLAIVKTGGKTPRLLECHHTSVPPVEGEERQSVMADAIRAMVKGVKTKPTTYAVCESSEFAVGRLLKVPLKGKSRVAAAVQFELEPYLAFPIEELAVDHLIVREWGGKTEVLVMGVRRELIEEHLTLLAAAGVGLEGAGLDGAGAAALWLTQHRQVHGLRAALHIRAHGASLAIANDKRMVFLRHMATTADKIHERPGAAGKEVQNILRAFLASWGGDDEIQSLTVSGVDLFEEERNLFEQEIHMPVDYQRLLDEASAQAAGGGPEESEQVWAPLVGVALAGASGVAQMDFLKNDPGLPVRRPGVLSHGLFAAGLAVLALAVYMGYCYLDLTRNRATLDRLGAQVYEEFKATFPDSEFAQSRPPGDVGGARSFEYMEKEAEAESLKSQAISIELFAQPSLLDVLAEFAKYMPNDKVAITDIRMSGIKNQEIIVSGEVKDSAVFGEIFDALKQSDVISVREDRLKRLSQGGKETFSITAVR